MYSYSAYGLSIASPIELPELSAGGTAAMHDSAVGASSDDVAFEVGRVPLEGQNPDRILVWAKPGDACLHYRGVASFRLISGSRVSVDAHPDADPRAVRLFLLGPVMALPLHQRKMLVLHASAVIVDGTVIGFAGEKGEGKSTLAGAMNAAGYPLFCDDVLAIDLREPERIVAYPGFPQLKLLPDSAEQIGFAASQLPRVHPDYEKRAARIDGQCTPQALSVKRLYILQTADEDAIEPVSPQNRLVELVRHSYLAPLLETTGESADHFRQVVLLANRIEIAALKRTRDLSRLRQTVEQVVKDLKSDR
ncbi:MAG TPA: hypothetical protein VFW23_00605 [Tepidisphaeraceae bacterium]|nr:hypothetical protein [Tepidisphaeraceae bacterium]